MFGRWRKNDGFKWVGYVPTQIVMRRKARKERLKQAADNVKEAAHMAARKSVAGIEQGVAQAGSAVAVGGNVVASGLSAGANRAMRRLGLLAQAAGLALAQAFQAPYSAAWIRNAPRLLALVGALAMVGAALRWAMAGTASGIDVTGRAMIGVGMLALACSAMPAIWRAFGPAFAHVALRALKTRQVKDGAAPAARAGSIAVTAALAAAVLGGGGWAAWRVTSAVLGHGPAVVGVARVLGSQTLKIGDTEVRLAGIAAPDVAQSCGEGSRKWRCGEDARRALIKIAAGKSLSCRARGDDPSGDKLAQCFDGATDIAASLVAGGYVWADRDDVMGYRTLEAAPRTAKSGVWKAASVPPWTYREKLWDEAQRAAPDGCPIKAQTTGSGRVYHLPWDDSYQRIRMAKAEVTRGGKQWFCTEAEARSAGFKPVTAARN